MIFGLLGVVQDGRTCAIETPSVQHKDDAAHYENCVGLQRTLGADVCETDERSRPLISSPNGDECGCPAASMNVAAASSGSPEKVGLEESCDDVGLVGGRASESSGPTEVAPERPANGEERLPMSRKEITLKVVVDERNKLSDGDEVFYIDPIVSSVPALVLANSDPTSLPIYTRFLVPKSTS